MDIFSEILIENFMVDHKFQHGYGALIGAI